jgi:peptide/nickel transport system permease protein
MLTYLLKRLGQLVGVSLIISVLVFLLVHLLPGDPSVIILGGATHRRTGRSSSTSWG